MTGPSSSPPSPATEDPLLEGDFGGPPGSGGGPRFHLRLTRTELHISGGPPGGPFAGGGVLRLADVVGSHTLRAPSLPSAAFFAVYAYPPRGCRSGGGAGGSRRSRRAPTFRVDEAPQYEKNRETAERWARLICCLVRGGEPPAQPGLPPEPPRRRLLLLLNPFGGRGRARSWCQSHVLPMISEAGISYNLVQTERANHARELVSGLRLDEWDGIVTVSGDGLLYEVVNGLLDRPDWAAALRVPLGVLPCGSGNGVAATINCRAGLSPALGLSLLQNCSVLLCQGSPAPLDLLSVTTASGGRRFGVLAVAWGLVADADVASESLRRLGPARFTLGAVARLLALHCYPGRLSYLPAGTPRLPHSLSHPVGFCGGSLQGKGGSSAEQGEGSTHPLETPTDKGGSTHHGEGSSFIGGTPTEKRGSPMGQRETPPDQGEGSTHPRETPPDLRGNPADKEGSTHCTETPTDHRGSPQPREPLPDREASTGSGSPRELLLPRAISDLGICSEATSGHSSLPRDDSEDWGDGFGDPPDLKGPLKFGDPRTPGDRAGPGDPPELQDPPTLKDLPASSSSGDLPHPPGNPSQPPGDHHLQSPGDSPSSPPGGPVDDLLVPLGQPLPPGWVTLEGDFVLVLATSQSHLGARLVAAPLARPDDGLIHLCFVRGGVSRATLLRGLLAMANGVAPGPPMARVVAKAFRLEPLTRRGVLTVDGERVEYGPLQGQIHRGLARLLAPAAPAP